MVGRTRAVSKARRRRATASTAGRDVVWLEPRATVEVQYNDAAADTVLRVFTIR